MDEKVLTMNSPKRDRCFVSWNEDDDSTVIRQEVFENCYVTIDGVSGLVIVWENRPGGAEVKLMIHPVQILYAENSQDSFVLYKEVD